MTKVDTVRIDTTPTLAMRVKDCSSGSIRIGPFCPTGEKRIELRGNISARIDGIASDVFERSKVDAAEEYFLRYRCPPQNGNKKANNPLWINLMRHERDGFSATIDFIKESIKSTKKYIDAVAI